MASFRKGFNETKRSITRRLSRKRSARNSQTSSLDGSCSVTTQSPRRNGRKESLIPDDTTHNLELENISEDLVGIHRKDTDVSLEAVSIDEKEKELSTDNDKNGNDHKSESDDVPETDEQLEADFSRSGDTDHLNKTNQYEKEETSFVNPEASKDVDN